MLPHAEADHEDGLGMVDGEERHVGQRAHMRCDCRDVDDIEWPFVRSVRPCDRASVTATTSVRPSLRAASRSFSSAGAARAMM